MKQDRQLHLKLSMLQYKFSVSKHNFKPMHINLSYPYIGTAKVSIVTDIVIFVVLIFELRNIYC